MYCCCFKTLFIFLCFQLLFSVPSFAAKLQKHVNVSNYSFILDGNDAILESTLPSLDNLLADGEVNGIPNGNDIQLSGSGFINLTLTFKTLQFEVCKSCRGASSVCFDTTENNIAEIIKCSGLPSYCKFEVKNEADYIYFGRVPVHESVFGGSCLRPTMHSGRVSVIGTSFFDSCKPKIDGVDKMIKLYVDIHSKCPIKVMNAKIHVPQVPTLNPSSNSTSNDESSTASVPVWAIVIMTFVGIAAIIIIAGFVYYLYKKRQTSSKIVPPTAEVAKTTVSKANIATIENSSKRKDDLNFTKFEPSKKSKKIKKKAKKQTTTQEPSKEPTEDAPVPHVTLPPTPATAAVRSNPPPFVPYAKIPRIFPRSLKSAKTDSLDETTKKDKLAMIESAPVSLHHYCIKPANPDLLDQMNENYPEVDHDVNKSEIDLLCSPVSKMFASTNEMALQYEQKLTAVGCDFDEFGRIISVSDGARRFLQDKLTPSTIVYFAFGAEYHQYLIDDVTILSKLSIPLLMVIAFQIRFADSNRKKACALLRRKLPTILGNFTAVQRKAMIFPMNVIEDAYCREPKYFTNTAGILSDSEGEERKNKVEEKVEQKEGKAGDKKRRKKSTKKHH